MDLKLENSVIGLKKYKEDLIEFNIKKQKNDELVNELSLKENELKSNKIELDSCKSTLKSIGTYTGRNIDNDIREIVNDAIEKTKRHVENFENKKQQLLHQKEIDIQENDLWLRSRLQQIQGNDSAHKVLSETENKALDFEISRRKFITESNERINNYEDGIVIEQLNCQTIVGELKGNQDKINNEYEPDINKNKQIIDEINEKYKPNINECQKILAEKIANKDDEINQLLKEKDNEKKLANREIDGYKSEFKQTKKQFNEQIRMAKLKNKPTTRMENNMVSRLNAINDQIKKVDNRLHKKVMSIDQKIEEVQSKHEKIIRKAEDNLDEVIINRDQEQESPVNALNGLLKERDGKINDIQLKIETIENESSSKENNLKIKINEEKKAQREYEENIDQQIITYVMSGDNCFEEVLNSENVKFEVLQKRVNTWMKMLSSIYKEKTPSLYKAEHEKQKGILIGESYEELQNELVEAVNYNDQLSLFSKNKSILTIGGGVIALIGIIIFIIIYIMFNISVGIVGIVLAVIGLSLSILSGFSAKKEFSKICKYISLAYDYQTFPNIKSHSTLVAQKIELSKIKELGSKLFDIHYGRTEAQNIHKEKYADINNDYDRNLKLLLTEFENEKAQINRDRDNKINHIKLTAEKEEEEYDDARARVEKEIQSLTIKIDNLEKRIKEIKENIHSYKQFIDTFEQNYRILEAHLQDDKWFAPMSYTHGKMSNELYIIPENGDYDAYGHKNIYHIIHNKKPLVINYDISSIKDMRIEEINKIVHNLIFDLMYAVYRINSRETYAQYVVDELSCTNDLKNVNVKNAFNIKEVVPNIDDINEHLKSFTVKKEKIAERGMTIDTLNEIKFNSQERPELYNILYVIYKPNERKSNISNQLRTLIPDCDKYGFLPIFICEKDTWERGIQEKQSMYKEIKELSNNIIIFDGQKYSIGN